MLVNKTYFLAFLGKIRSVTKDEIHKFMCYHSNDKNDLATQSIHKMLSSHTTHNVSIVILEICEMAVGSFFQIYLIFSEIAT